MSGSEGGRGDSARIHLAALPSCGTHACLRLNASPTPPRSEPRPDDVVRLARLTALAAERDAEATRLAREVAALTAEAGGLRAELAHREGAYNRMFARPQRVVLGGRGEPGGEAAVRAATSGRERGEAPAGGVAGVRSARPPSAPEGRVHSAADGLHGPASGRHGVPA